MVATSFTVYGVAEPFGDGHTRVWPKHILHRKGLDVRDAWLILEGIRLSGICVVGLVRTGRRLVYSRISYDPSPEPPGNWGSTSTQGGNARWRRIRRKTAWARLATV